MARTIEFIPTTGDLDAVKSRFGFYSGSADRFRAAGSDECKSFRLSNPVMKQVLSSCKSREDLDDIVGMLEVSAARMINSLLPEGKTAQYHGLSYEASRKAFASYGIEVVKYR
jgi:hypothetical protein